jgi:hypothetical protein
MSRFIVAPNFPHNRVDLCVMSGQYPQLCRCVEKLGIEVILTDKDLSLPGPVAYHGDLQLCHLGEDQVVLDPGAAYLESHLTEKGFRCRSTCRPGGNRYPEDVRLGMLLLNRCGFGLLESAAPEILISLLLDDRELVFSRQGYARCSVCVAGERLAITADTGLAQLLEKKGVECLLVEPGDILLEGYNTGFLGGCCGLLAPDLLAFTGSLDRYREGKRVRDFLIRHQIKWIELMDGPMLDIGGILPLMEKE